MTHVCCPACRLRFTPAAGPPLPTGSVRFATPFGGA
jgi:hypothetical protein